MAALIVNDFQLSYDHNSAASTLFINYAKYD